MLQTALSFETARATRDFFTKNWHISAIFAAGFLMLFGLLTTAKAQAPRPAACYPHKVFNSVMARYDAKPMFAATGTPAGDRGNVMEVWTGTDPEQNGNKRVWIITRHKDGICFYLTGFNWTGPVPKAPAVKGKGPKIEG